MNTIEQLRQVQTALENVIERFERCCIKSGNSRKTAASSTERHRQALALMPAIIEQVDGMDEAARTLTSMLENEHALRRASERESGTLPSRRTEGYQPQGEQPPLPHGGSSAMRESIDAAELQEAVTQAVWNYGLNGCQVADELLERFDVRPRGRG